MGLTVGISAVILGVGLSAEAGFPEKGDGPVAGVRECFAVLGLLARVLVCCEHAAMFLWHAMFAQSWHACSLTLQPSLVLLGQLDLRSVRSRTVHHNVQNGEIAMPTCDEPFGVEAGNGAKKVEIDRCPGVEVELRLVVIGVADWRAGSALHALLTQR